MIQIGDVAEVLRQLVLQSLHVLVHHRMCVGKNEQNRQQLLCMSRLVGFQEHVRELLQWKSHVWKTVSNLGLLSQLDRFESDFDRFRTCLLWVFDGSQWER